MEGEQIICDYCLCCWHLSCLQPPLLEVPPGVWLCSESEDAGHRQATEEALAYHGRWVVSKFPGVGKLYWGQLSYCSMATLAIQYEDAEACDNVTVQQVRGEEQLVGHRSVALQREGVMVPPRVLSVFQLNAWLVLPEDG